MVAIRSLLFIAAALVGAASAQRFYDEDILALRDYLDNYNLESRSYRQSLNSIREYIDEQVELALRDYIEDNQEQMLFARATAKEIADKLKFAREQLADAKKWVKKWMDKIKALDKKSPTYAADKKKLENELSVSRDAQANWESQESFWLKQVPSNDTAKKGKK